MSPKRKKTTVPKEEKKSLPGIPFEVGKVYGDVKIIKIEPAKMFPIVYIPVLRGKRMENGSIKKDPHDPIVYDVLRKGGTIIGSKIVFDEEDVHRMSVEDFKNFIEAKEKVCKLMG